MNWLNPDEEATPSKRLGLICWTLIIFLNEFKTESEMQAEP